MNPIIAKMYGLDPNGGGGTPVDTGYYGSFGYWNDIANGVGPPPASEGGPTAMQIAMHEGYADETGMLSSGTHSIVDAMYGGGPAKIDQSNNAMNPNYQAGFNGQTVGGIGNTDAFGNPVNWSQPQGQQLKEGDTHSTPAGDYKVEKNPWGQFVLVPQGDALKSTGAYLTNMTAGQHHVGINPNTGEVWYQEAAGGTNFSGGGNSYYENPNGPGYTPPNGGGNNGGGNNSGGGRSAQDVLKNGITGADGNTRGQYDPYTGLYSNNEPIQWGNLVGEGGDLTRLNQEFETLAASGAFGEWGANVTDETKQKAETAYARLLRMLGLA